MQDKSEDGNILLEPGVRVSNKQASQGRSRGDKAKHSKAAVAEASGEGDAAVAEMEGLGDDAGKEEWVWGPQGAETMHPFLAVRRMTRKQLAKEAAEPKVGQITPRFNCQIVEQVLTCVTVGVVKSTLVDHNKAMRGAIPDQCACCGMGERSW